MEDKKDVLKTGSTKFNVASSAINPEYTFDNFVSLWDNRMAYDACLEVSLFRNSFYNPLILYGGSGLGKTHLLMSIGNYMIGNGCKKVLFFWADQYISEYYRCRTASDESLLYEFREKIRSADALLIDDIQYFTRKYENQDEFAWIVKDMINDNKVVVLTCDKHPAFIPEICKRCSSCFWEFKMVEMEAPKYRTRVMLLEMYADELKCDIPHRTIEYIAHNISSSIAELKGAFNQMYVKSKFDPKYWENDRDSIDEILWTYNINRQSQII